MHKQVSGFELKYLLSSRSIGNFLSETEETL